MKTKYLVTFLNRAAHLDADIELADVIAIASKSGALYTAGSPHLFDAVVPAQHPRLAARTNTTYNRKMAIRHLKASLCASFLKEAYEDVTAYMQDILEAAARNGLDPNRLIGEHKVSFEANDILQAKGWHAVVHLVAKSVFRKLEQKKCTKDLLQEMNSKLNLGVPQSKIDKALPFLEIRHLLVHAEGVADQSFCKAFPAFGASPGTKLKLDFTVLQSARKALLELVQKFDEKVIACGVVAAADTQP